MNFHALIAAQWKGLTLSWRPMLVHIGVYAVLCLILAVVGGENLVEAHLNRMLLVTAVASVMIQKAGVVARLLWLGVAIGEAGLLVSNCTRMVLPGVPAGLVQIGYAGLLLVLFLLLCRSDGGGGLPTLTPDRPLTPSRTPVGRV